MITFLFGIVIGAGAIFIFNKAFKRAAPDLYIQLKAKVDEIESRQKLIRKIAELEGDISGEGKKIVTFVAKEK